MAEFPSLPLFTDAYLADTTHLTTTEHGAYLLLLMTAWRTPGCCLPDDDMMLARYAKMTRDKWKKIRPTLVQFFRVRDGQWHQARLQDELQHLQSRRKQNSDAGRASAQAKALKRRNRDAASVDDPLQRNGNEPSTPIPRPNTVTKVTDAGAPPDDPKKMIFDVGVSVLTGAGMKIPQARSVLGKWLKDHDIAEVLAAVIAAREQNPASPVEWISGRFRSIAIREDQARAVSRSISEQYRQMDMPGPRPGDLQH